MSNEEYIKQVRKFKNHAALLRFWQAIREGTPLPGWPAGRAFEFLILRAFEIERAEVTWPYEVRLEGMVVEQVDGAVHRGGLFCLIEAKDYNEAIDYEPIAKLRDKLARRPPATIGLVFSKRGFSSPAKTLAKYLVPQRILLWEGNEVEFALGRKGMWAGLQRKFRYAVEHGLPDFNIATEGRA